MTARRVPTRDRVVAGQFVPPAAAIVGEALELVPPKIALAVQLSIRGWPNATIAHRLGVGSKTVGNWLTKYADYVDAQLRTLAATEDLMRPMLPKALRVYHEALDSGDTRVAQDVLDRAMGRPVTRVLEDSHRIIEINLVPIPTSREEGG